MACTGLRPSFRKLLQQASHTHDVPSFLVPALSQPAKSQTQSRKFSSTRTRQSRVGREPITIPPEVSLRFYDLPIENARSRKADTPTSAVEIKGPLGTLHLPLAPYITTNLSTASRKLALRVKDPDLKHQRAMWGTTTSLLSNSISGVSEGHVCILRLVGVGYRATIEAKPLVPTSIVEYPNQPFVNLKLGFAHPVEMGVPEGVKATVPQPTRILLEGPDKQIVTHFAAKIREWRKPEPYKGKGIFVNDETIKLKAKKIK